MIYILAIDTALEVASVCLSADGASIGHVENHDQKEHSSWLHSAIQHLLDSNGIKAAQLNAIGVNNGPGSYTGLRMGLSTAKGFCYALSIPLIITSSLELIAFANKENNAGTICPVIDARRMEIYYAVYTKGMELLHEPAAHIIENNSFAAILEKEPVLFCGTGSKKMQETIHHPNALFSNVCGSAIELALLSFRKYTNNEFASLANTEPLYIKDFYTSGQKRQ